MVEKNIHFFFSGTILVCHITHVTYCRVLMYIITHLYILQKKSTDSCLRGISVDEKLHI